MTEQSSGQGRSDEWSRYFPGDQYAGEQYYGASGSPRPGQAGSGPGGYGPGRDGAGYGSSARDGAGYGSSGQGGAGAARPSPGMPGSASTGPGDPGPGMATAPIWQAAPGQGAPGQAGPGFGGPSQPMGRPMMESQAADARGFLSALFDFSFTSFVTTRIIKVFYVLILIVVLLSALSFTYDMFRVSALVGLLTLVIGDPLFIVLVMASSRLVLEAFVVRIRIAEDVRAMRERDGR